MPAAIRAGFAYFALIFALGFALGVLRQLVIIPRIGELAAVCLEVPVLLAVAWPICGWLLRRHGVAARLADRAVMALVAFALLMLAELALAVLLAGQSPAEHWAAYRRLPVQIGLAGQIAFALMPLARRRRAP